MDENLNKKRKMNRSGKNQIDRLVYELYGLTKEEIETIEGKV